MYLLDVPALSEQMRPKPNPSVVRWFDSTPNALLFTSVAVIGEITKGLVRVPSTRHDRWLGAVLSEFGDRILPVTLDIAQRWGEMNGAALRGGVPLPSVDSLIAATAIVHNLTVVTRNVRDFERCGATVFNPWGSA